jgi:hypothetical protein
MALEISVLETLRGGFWPSSKFGLDVEDEFMDDDTVREEFTEDAPFVGCRHNCPATSFHVGRDMYAGYFIAMRSADGDLLPFWVARAVTNPSPDPGHRNQIQIQYWMPNFFQHLHADTYVGWNSKEGNVWCEDKGFLPSWSQTNRIMTAWKSKVHCWKADPNMRITTTKFKFSIGCLTLFNIYMQTHTLGGIQRKGMCGVKTRASCLLGPKLIVS